MILLHLLSKDNYETLKPPCWRRVSLNVLQILTTVCLVSESAEPCQTNLGDITNEMMAACQEAVRSTFELFGRFWSNAPV